MKSLSTKEEASSHQGCGALECLAQFWGYSPVAIPGQHGQRFEETRLAFQEPDCFGAIESRHDTEMLRPHFKGPFLKLGRSESGNLPWHSTYATNVKPIVSVFSSIPLNPQCEFPASRQFHGWYGSREFQDLTSGLPPPLPPKPSVCPAPKGPSRLKLCQTPRR